MGGQTENRAVRLRPLGAARGRGEAVGGSGWVCGRGGRDGEGRVRLQFNERRKKPFAIHGS